MRKVTKNLTDDGLTLCCSKPPSYNDKFDAWFCPACRAWIETACGDPACWFCPGRPETAPARKARKKTA